MDLNPTVPYGTTSAFAPFFDINIKKEKGDNKKKKRIVPFDLEVTVMGLPGISTL